MKNKLRPLLIPVAIVAVSAILFGAGFFARGLYEGKQEKAASVVASQFVDSVLAGDSDTAYNLMSQDYQSVMSKEVFGEVAKNMKSDNSSKKEASTVKTSEGTVFFYQQVEGLDENLSGKTEANFAITLSETDGEMEVISAALQ